MTTNANNNPLAVEVEAGKDYYFCSCGKTSTPPFCDGAHQGSDLEPTHYHAEESTTIYLCNCGRSKSGLMCDGSHQN